MSHQMRELGESDNQGQYGERLTNLLLPVAAYVLQAQLENRKSRRTALPVLRPPPNRRDVGRRTTVVVTDGDSSSVMIGVHHPGLSLGGTLPRQQWRGFSFHASGVLTRPGEP